MQKPQSNEFNFVLEGADTSLLEEVDDLLSWKVLPAGADIHDILVSLGVFSSKSQSRKNWNKGDLQPDCFNWFSRVGKKRLDIIVRT